ncbi:MAG: hypothetical protein WA441_12720 [Methyloceanibacter sp.]
MRKLTPLLGLALVAVSTAGVFGASAAGPSSGDFAGLVEINGGRKLYLECRGTGEPTVILEAGLRNSADIWIVQPDASEAVLPAVAAFTRVCAYGRPAPRSAPTSSAAAIQWPMPGPPRTPSPTCSKPQQCLRLTTSSVTRPEA